MPASKKKRTLPRALVENAEALAAEKRRRLRERGKELIAITIQKRQEAASLFYEMGQALRELAEPPVYVALGYSSFQGVVEKELDMTLGYATQLKLVPEKIGHKLAIDLGVAKSIAVASALDVPGVTLSGTSLHFETQRFNETANLLKATAKHIEDLTKTLRQKQQSKSGARRGRSTTPSERNQALSLEKALHKSGAMKATVKCIATKPGQPSDIVIRVNIERLRMLSKIISQIAE